jgi:hypothetical protein
MILSPDIKPRRITGVTLIEDEDSLLIYQTGEGSGTRVNIPVAFIWQHCNGINNFADIVTIVSEARGKPASEVIKDVSDIITRLYTQKLVKLHPTHQEATNVRPLARIALSDFSGELSPLQRSFVRLLGGWFDPVIVDPTKKPDIYINLTRSNAYLDSAALRIYLAADGELPGDEYDLIFSTQRDQRIPGEMNILLPENFRHGLAIRLDPLEQAKVVNLLGEKYDGHHTPPAAATNPSTRRIKPKLTIGMATYDDYDGVYFSVQAIRMYHPEVTAETEILLIDNNPSGPCAQALKELQNSVPGYRYLPVSDIRGTAVRDFVFREATGEYVMCIDSHVFIVPGAIRKLIDYFDAHPDTADLLQGPMLGDDLVSFNTHFEPVWGQGMFGIWGRDERGKDPDGEPFEIPMQGLGLAACRKTAWQGYNSRFSGFGGEEGYIHQKFRNAGARTLCLPFLRWMHRFARPLGIRYPINWQDRIRNYLIGFREVGLDIESVLLHFRESTSDELVDDVVSKLEEEERNPFSFFDAIYCINVDSQNERWDAMQERFDKLGITDRVKRFSAVVTPESHHVGCALSHRKIVEIARKMGYRNVLVLEDDAMFHEDSKQYLENALEELEKVDWNVFYLGGMKWGEKWGNRHEKLAGCQYLEKPVLMTCTHAVAYSNMFFDTLLDELPENEQEMKEWVGCHRAIDQYLLTQEGLVVISPVIATQQSIFGSEDEAMRGSFV